MKRVSILAYPGCSGAQLFALYDSLLLANLVAQVRLGRPSPVFDVRIVGVSGRSVVAAGGVRVGLKRLHTRPDLVVVPGFESPPIGAIQNSLGALAGQVRFVADAFRRGVSIASVCVGAFVLGE